MTTTALISLGLLIASLVVTSLLSTHLLGQIDDQLRVTARAIGAQGLTQIRTGNSSLMPSTYYVEAQYIDGRGGSMMSSDTANEYGVPTIGRLSLEQTIAYQDSAQLFTVDSNIPGRQWRVIALPIKDVESQEYRGVVAIALPLAGMTETVARTRLIVALSDVSLICLGAMAAAYLVTRSFRPLRQIEAVAGQIATGDLSARVPVTEPATTEVGSLQRALNTMLQQNEQAFAVQRVAQERVTRFVSDASHELRTPLAAIRGYGELYRMGGVPPERQSEVMGRIESEASRMGRLVEELLQLARMDEGRQVDMVPVNLTDICRGALSDMVVLAPDRECSLLPLSAAPAGVPSATQATADADSSNEPPAIYVIGDADSLSQVVTNLLGNVTRHTPAGSPVEIAVGITEGPFTPTHHAPSVPVLVDTSGATAVAVVEVRDHGPGIPPGEADKVFRRFYRSDTSRNRQTGGSGLGLPIVAAIIARHGGSVQMLETPGGGATVHIELPTRYLHPDTTMPTETASPCR